MGKDKKTNNDRKRYTLLFSTILALLACFTATISTFSWFQINTSFDLNNSVTTNGMRTDAFVYNKNASHGNDDGYAKGIQSDDGGTLPYDHSNQNQAVDYYIIGDGGTFDYMDSDASKAIQMYKNPNNNNDAACYFSLKLDVNTVFHIVRGKDNTVFGWGAVNSTSKKYASFTEQTGEIKCVSADVFDVYINVSGEIFLQDHIELVDETQLGNTVGYYIVGNTVTGLAGKTTASSGAFTGGNFDLGHGYALRSGDSTYPEGAYFGLHLYVGDVFKLWDGNANSGWYGWNTLVSDSKSMNYDGINACFAAATTGGDDKNIECKYEGYYNIYVTGESSGNIYTHNITIERHSETNSGSLSPRASKIRPNIEKRAASHNEYYIVGDFNSWSTTDGRLEMYNADNDQACYLYFKNGIAGEFKIIHYNNDRRDWDWYGKNGKNQSGDNGSYSANTFYKVYLNNSDQLYAAEITNEEEIKLYKIGTSGYFVFGSENEDSDIKVDWGGNGSTLTTSNCPYNSSSGSFSNIYLKQGQEIKGFYSGGHSDPSWYSGGSNYTVPADGYYDITVNESGTTVRQQTAHGVSAGYYINGSANSWDLSTATLLDDPLTDGNTAQKSGIAFAANAEFQIWHVTETNYEPSSGDKTGSLGASYAGMADNSGSSSNNVRIINAGTYGVYFKNGQIYLADQTQCTITLNTIKDGATTTDTDTVTRNTNFNLPSLTDYFEYTCTGWKLNNEGDPYSGSITVTGDMSFTATYTQKTSTTYYFDIAAVYESWGSPSSIYVHAFNSNGTALSPDVEASPINLNADSNHINRFWSCDLRLGGGDKINIYTGSEKGVFTYQTEDITYQSAKNLYVVSNSVDGSGHNTGSWNTNTSDGAIKSINFYNKLGDNSPTSIATYQVLGGETFDLAGAPSISNRTGYSKPSAWTEGSNSTTIGATTRATNYVYTNVTTDLYLFAVYPLSSFFLQGYIGGGQTDGAHSKWGTGSGEYINTGTFTGGTLTFSNVSLTAKDQIKLFSAGKSQYLPGSGQNWDGYTTYAKQVDTGGNIEIRYTGLYNITASISDDNTLSNLQIEATQIEGSNFTVNGNTGSGSINKNGSGNFVFTWSNQTFKIGNEFAVETVASSTDSVVYGAWGYQQLGTYSSSNYYKGSASSTDSRFNKLGSVHHQTNATISFVLNTGTVNIIDGSISDYECGDNTNSPTGIYLAYCPDKIDSEDYSIPSTLAASEADTNTTTLPMFYDSDRTLMYYSANKSDLFDKKASYSILTVSTKVKVKVFHGLDQKDQVISDLTDAPLYNKETDAQVYPDTTSVTGVDSGSRYFTLEAGHYVVTVIGRNGYAPSASGSDYKIAIKHVTSSKNISSEHEVPVFAVGRGMPGSDLENGDYSHTKAAVGASHYNRYIPFYAEAWQSETYPCYAKNQANSSTNVTLKSGDEFVFTDGFASKSSFTLGTDTTSAMVSTVGSKIVIHRSGTYTISAANDTDDTFTNATFTITKVTLDVVPTPSGNDENLQNLDANPTAYSKQHGIRVLNATGSTLNFGGKYDSSLLDAGANYVSFVIELRHITDKNGKLSANFTGLANGTKFRVYQVASSSSNPTAMTNANLAALSSLDWTTFNTADPQAICTNATVIGNSSTISNDGAVDRAYALSTLIEIQIPITSFFNASGERVYNSAAISFGINISFVETITEAAI